MTHVVPAPKVPEKTADQATVREVVSMRKWLRLTARKHAVVKQSDNHASRAAADALDSLLRGSRKLG